MDGVYRVCRVCVCYVHGAFSNYLDLILAEIRKSKENAANNSFIVYPNSKTRLYLDQSRYPIYRVHDVQADQTRSIQNRNAHSFS